MHFVFPAVLPSGLTIDEMVDAAAEPGPLWFTREVGVEEHIFGLWWVSGWSIDRFGAVVWTCRR